MQEKVTDNANKYQFFHTWRMLYMFLGLFTIMGVYNLTLFSTPENNFACFAFQNNLYYLLFGCSGLECISLNISPVSGLKIFFLSVISPVGGFNVFSFSDFPSEWVNQYFFLQWFPQWERLIFFPLVISPVGLKIFPLVISQ